MELAFLIILIIRIIFGAFILIIGFLLGAIWGKNRYQKRINKLLDKVKFKFLREAMDKLEKDKK